VQNYLDTVDKQVSEQETVFRARAGAQRLAAALGARLLCRRGAKEARPDAPVREDRHGAGLPRPGQKRPAQRQGDPQGSVSECKAERRSRPDWALGSDVPRAATMSHKRDAIIQLEHLDQLSRAELRALWTEELGESPPASLGRDILARKTNRPRPTLS